MDADLLGELLPKLAGMPLEAAAMRIVIELEPIFTECYARGIDDLQTQGCVNFGQWWGFTQ